VNVSTIPQADKERSEEEEQAAHTAVKPLWAARMVAIVWVQYGTISPIPSAF
jgi:hypothetical protein